ncbi:uncharacterized protein LOC127750728 [Frankliniella occidentalis]|uniref:Uncharacterized protein LOC127750728 n=1 Tax=Frankliniella occidentalis TaxID=133901 RepID=A0A9C6XS75_FRAOC|nr:uncharacterized protein LOC127750728 [Frankliniella occidentalis]
MTKVAALPVHKEFGLGYQIHLRDKEKKVFFVILPNRIPNQIGLESFGQYSADIESRKPPFLIFKGMDGSAFDIAIKPFSVEMAKLAVHGEVFVEAEVEQPGLDTSLDWLDELTAAGPSEEVEKLQEEKRSLPVDVDDDDKDKVDASPAKKVKMEK